MDETTIANRALARIGARAILSMDDTSSEAVACKLAYPGTRDELLRSHRWNFARKRATLSRLAESPAFEYQYQYELPTDCLRVMEINDVDSWQYLPPHYELEGRKVLTDSPTLQIKYIGRATDTSLFDALFVRVLALSLAAEIAEKVTGSPVLTQQIMSEKESLAAGLAKRIDSNESRSTHNTRPTAQDSGFIRARFSGQ